LPGACPEHARSIPRRMLGECPKKVRSMLAKRERNLERGTARQVAVVKDEQFVAQLKSNLDYTRTLALAEPRAGISDLDSIQ
jgi:hypothetical protein